MPIEWSLQTNAYITTLHWKQDETREEKTDNKTEAGIQIVVR